MTTENYTGSKASVPLAASLWVVVTGRTHSHRAGGTVGIIDKDDIDKVKE